MEMVTADRIIEVCERLHIQDLQMLVISEKISTIKEKTRACVDLYLNCCPYVPSWKDITIVLYICEEMAAAREAKSFYRQKGE